MNAAERERQHQRNLARIDGVQVVTGRGDQARIDHEGTLLERARLTCEEFAAHQATERGLAALDRLLRIVEENQSPRTAGLSAFIAAVWNERPMHLTHLRGQDMAIADDMLDVLDAYRHARLNLVENVRGGPRRVMKALDRRSVASG